MKHARQLELFEQPTPRRCAKRWSEELSQRLERPVSLSFGRARHHVVVVKSRGQGLHLRLNEHFASAPEEVSEALCSWLKNGKRAQRACKLLDHWIEGLSQRLTREPRRAPRIRQAGEEHQLEPLAASLVKQHFAGELDSPGQALGPWSKRITWGRRGSRRPRRSIQLGSYDPEQRLIRIHPVLDQAFVPRFFLRYVLFHELLHAALHQAAPEAPRGRPHPPAFQARERAYPEFERALAWQKTHLRKLLVSAQSLASH